MLGAVRSLLCVFTCAVAVGVAACSGRGGNYVQGDRRGRDVDRGETNGRRFDFISNTTQADDWQVRVTGSSMWVGFARDEAIEKLGSISLTDPETRQLWKLIDALDIPNRKNGTQDEDVGYVSLQLKEPGDDGADLHQVYVSRGTTDENLLALARYLQDLVQKYKKERPEF